MRAIPNMDGNVSIPFFASASMSFMSANPLEQLVNHTSLPEDEERYKEKIDEMVNLGFPNRQANLFCLKRAGGDVNIALNLILDM